MNEETTICALATAPGGAIGIIRVSGADAITITDKIFSKSLSAAKSQTVHYGEIKDADGNTIDDVLVSVFRAPHSYTGEDSTEISCHGSRYILSKVLELLILNGCRQAMPGEYTQRAFLNGKMDLSQAEAVADLIAASNQATHKIAMSQLRGNFSNELAELRNQLLKITSMLELELDFSDQDVNFADRNQLLILANQIDNRITTLTHSFETGKALKEGIPVAIIGKTSVGKSTLLNRLLGEDKAIVSNIHGTTRDVIEDTTQINGVTFRFIDTAGLRHTDDEIEQLGIERTYRKLDEATIILWLIDSVPTREEKEEIKSKTADKKLIIVENKIDKEQPSGLYPDSIKISAKFGTNIDTLESAIYKASDIPEINANDVIVTNARHYDALKRSHESISRVIEGLNIGLSGDLLSEDLRDCIHILAEIVGGEVTTDEVLGNIFSHFCIGK
ncbi:MAG TPA: tRNA uridine-5-carboxymethylaminomethyl(34) synthesis GTPase MnmE [Xylanibacter oryzae]|nr:tRNA uridine-5-carboxymethylaminomethyl(34) synthesis GTPase MnmE [Xylanibacter oryzae]